MVNENGKPFNPQHRIIEQVAEEAADLAFGAFPEGLNEDRIKQIMDIQKGVIISQDLYDQLREFVLQASENATFSRRAVNLIADMPKRD